MSIYLNDVATFILSKISNDLTLKQFAQGLEDSLSLDTSGNTPPDPPSPESIMIDYGISITTQRDYRISLSKKEANDFLNSIGKIITLPSIQKNFTGPGYKIFFERDPVYASNGALICTYAEWMHWSNHKFPPGFPEALSPYL